MAEERVTKVYMNKPRFPRLETTHKQRKVERKLRKAYNKCLRGKSVTMYHHFGYDVYKNKRRGWRAKYAFLYLAEKLIKADIDPKLYINVMSRFGKFRSVKWMPPIGWLVKDATIEKFRWFYRSQKKSYPLRLDFRKALKGWSPLDIYASIRDSSQMVKQVAEGNDWPLEAAILALYSELSPWFLYFYLLDHSSNQADMRKIAKYDKRYNKKHSKLQEVIKKAFRAEGFN